MVPYSFASTSHFIFTFSLSFTVVLGATILGFQKHGLEFFSLLVPAGCPLALLPLLVLIEFISYLSRNVSLGLRLGANILSGHMLLNILAGFTYNIMTSGFIFFLFRFSTFSIYNSILWFRVRNSFYTSPSFCCFN
jgi:F-type H+-transporting ATPase subunit a